MLRFFTTTSIIFNFSSISSLLFVKSPSKDTSSEEIFFILVALESIFILNRNEKDVRGIRHQVVSIVEELNFEKQSIKVGN